MDEYHIFRSQGSLHVRRLLCLRAGGCAGMDVCSTNELIQIQFHRVIPGSSSALWWFTSVSRRFHTQTLLCPLCSRCCRLQTAAVLSDCMRVCETEIKKDGDQKANHEACAVRDSEGRLNQMLVHLRKKQHAGFFPFTRLLDSFIRHFLCLFKNKQAPFLRLSSCLWLRFITSWITVHAVAVPAVVHLT